MARLPTVQQHHLALFQSAVADALVKRGDADADSVHQHPSLAAAHQVVTAAASGEVESPLGGVEECAKLALELAAAKVFGPRARAQQLEQELEFSSCDPLWAEAVAVQAMQAMFAHRPDLVLHLGDVYYAGTTDEYRRNFLGPLSQARRTQPTPVYNLPGNHDYYSGGKPFYDALTSTNQPPLAPAGTHAQEASFFCLRNDRWQLQGMDTGYFDHDVFKVAEDLTHLHPEEANWHQAQLSAAGDRKVILLSHHQLFSAFLNIGHKPTQKGGDGLYPPAVNPSLLEVFEPYFGQVALWLWGHEHLLEIYAPFEGLQRGRCVGSSAVPEFVDARPYTVKYDVPLLERDGKPILPGTSGAVYNHGYVILELRTDGTGTATVVLDPDAGTACWTFSAENIDPVSVSHIHEGAAGTDGGVVVDLMGGAYPALRDGRARILDEVEHEEARFARTLEAGSERLATLVRFAHANLKPGLA